MKKKKRVLDETNNSCRSRGRGYSFESDIVKEFNCMDGWKALRLGGTTKKIPDILAVNNKENTLLAIEAKSGTGTILRVPHDQITRCLSIGNFFANYNRFVILAFKFSIKKRVKKEFERRKLREYYLLINTSEILDNRINLSCDYNGKVFAVSDRKIFHQKYTNLDDVISYLFGEKLYVV